MAPRNIILITIDSLRASDIGCIGGGNLTPNIDALARESILYNEAISNGPGTPQSFPSIFASVYPLMNERIILSRRFLTLAEVLNDSGFLTVGFHSNPFLSKFFGWNRGFDLFRDLSGEASRATHLFKGLTQKEGAGGLLLKPVKRALSNKSIRNMLKRVYSLGSDYPRPYTDGESVNNVVIGWLKEKGRRRFFLWVHYMDPHEPYFPPDPWLKLISSRKEASKINLQFYGSNKSNVRADVIKKAKKLYDAEVNYVDQCVGNFIRAFEDLGLLEDTMMVLTSDHGEAFYEHGEKGHDHILYDELIHVPLLINGIEQRGVVDEPIGLIDLPPMILKNLGINKPKTFVGGNGVDLQGAVISESAKFDYANYKYDFKRKIISYRTNKWKLIINDIEGKTELYNLERDPEEQKDVSDWNKDIERDFTQQIKNHIYMLNTARIDMTRADNILQSIKSHQSNHTY